MARKGYGALKEKLVLASLMKSMQPTKMAKDLTGVINQAYEDGAEDMRKELAKAFKKCQKKDPDNFEQCVINRLEPSQ